MFVAENLVFIELHKTGCSHIGRLLSRYLDGEQIGKHNPADEALLATARHFVGSVRNPWEWYVSLWAYGCDHKGAVYQNVVRPRNYRQHPWLPNPLHGAHHLWAELRRRPGQWEACFTDVADAEAFRRWLHMMNSPRHWHDYGEWYGVSDLSRYAGLLTYRYVSLFCRGGMARVRQRGAFPTYEALLAYVQDALYVTHFIRNEQLEADFVRVMAACGVPLTAVEETALYAADKTNTSSRKYPASYYYDAETAALVAQREKLIVDTFDYQLEVGF